MTTTDLMLLQLELEHFHKSFNLNDPQDFQRYLDYIRKPRYLIDANGNQVNAEQNGENKNERMENL